MIYFHHSIETKHISRFRIFGSRSQNLNFISVHACRAVPCILWSYLSSELINYSITIDNGTCQHFNKFEITMNSIHYLTWTSYNNTQFDDVNINRTSDIWNINLHFEIIILFLNFLIYITVITLYVHHNNTMYHTLFTSHQHNFKFSHKHLFHWCGTHETFFFHNSNITTQCRFGFQISFFSFWKIFRKFEKLKKLILNLTIWKFSS